MIIDCNPESTTCVLEDLEAGDVFRYVSGTEQIADDTSDEEDRIFIVTDEVTDDDGDEAGDVDPDHGRYLCVQLSDGALWRLSPDTKVVLLPSATLRTGGAA